MIFLINKVFILNYQFVTNTVELEQLSQQLIKSKALALDTEFIRTRTYYPQLGLIQVYDGQQVTLIDPVNINDWQSFVNVLNQPDSLKYFHACSEDLDVFMHEYNQVPQPLLDSQIMAAFLDNPISAGYATLVNKYLGVILDKSETRTDWLARPLAEKQCTYAAADVYYLLPLMDKLLQQVTEKGWLDAAYEECQLAINRKLDLTQPQEAYLNIKHAWQLKGIQLSYLQKLAEWRLNLAREQDIAVNFIVHEEVLWKIARYQPTSLAELDSLGMRGKEVRLYGQTLLNILKQPVEPLSSIKPITDYPDYKKIAQKIKDLSATLASETGLSSEILSSRRQINQYIKWLNDSDSQEVNKPELLSGWRGKLFNNRI